MLASCSERLRAALLVSALVVTGCSGEDDASAAYEVMPAAPTRTLAPTLKRVPLGPEHMHRLVLRRDERGELSPSCGGETPARAERDAR